MYYITDSARARISVLRRVAADNSGFQAGRRRYTIGPTRFVTLLQISVYRSLQRRRRNAFPLGVVLRAANQKS